MTPEQEFCQTWSLRWKVQNQKNFYSALILGRKKTNKKKCKIPATYSGCLGNQYTSLGTQTQKALFKFFSPLYFNKKYVQEEIDDFTMHLIISKWLQGQKCQQKRKTMKQKEVQRKEETVYESVFINLTTY